MVPGTKMYNFIISRFALYVPTISIIIHKTTIITSVEVFSSFK